MSTHEGWANYATFTIHNEMSNDAAKYRVLWDYFRGNESNGLRPKWGELDGHMRTAVMDTVRDICMKECFGPARQYGAGLTGVEFCLLNHVAESVDWRGIAAAWYGNARLNAAALAAAA